jgi:hypothetical protein
MSISVFKVAPLVTMHSGISDGQVAISLDTLLFPAFWRTGSSQNLHTRVRAPVYIQCDKKVSVRLTILLPNRYNLYKVLVRTTTFFQLSLFCATFFQFRTSMLLTSSKTSSSQRILGFPIGRLDMGFHLLIFCTILSSVHTFDVFQPVLALFFLINPTTFCPSSISLISWLVLILQQPSSVLVGPYIFLTIFLSNVINLLSRVP